MVSCNLYSWGQVFIVIDSIKLDGVIEAKMKNTIISNFGGGPTATINISITNQSSKPLIIFGQDDYKLYCEYFYDGILHKSMSIFLTIPSDKPLAIPHNNTYSEKVSISMFLPYEILEIDDVVLYDHIPKLNEMLSSIRLVFMVNGRKYASQNIPIVEMGVSFFWNTDIKYEINNIH